MHQQLTCKEEGMRKPGPDLKSPRATGVHHNGNKIWPLKQWLPIGGHHCHGLDSYLAASCKVQLMGLLCHVADNQLRSQYIAHRRSTLRQ